MTPKSVSGQDWILRTSIGLLITFALAWAGFLHAQIGDLRADDRETIRSVQSSREFFVARLSEIEPALAVLQTDVTALKKSIEKIDNKLDAIFVRARKGKR